MKKKSNLDILMIMFGFTFFSGSMLIGQKLSSGVEFLEKDRPGKDPYLIQAFAEAVQLADKQLTSKYLSI